MGQRCIVSGWTQDQVLFHNESKSMFLRVKKLVMLSFAFHVIRVLKEALSIASHMLPEWWREGKLGLKVDQWLVMEATRSNFKDNACIRLTLASLSKIALQSVIEYIWQQVHLLKGKKTCLSIPSPLVSRFTFCFQISFLLSSVMEGTCWSVCIILNLVITDQVCRLLVQNRYNWSVFGYDLKFLPPD